MRRRREKVNVSRTSLDWREVDGVLSSGPAPLFFLGGNLLDCFAYFFRSETI